MNGIDTRAHRFSYELAYGPIPFGVKVLHRCDNPPCVRPEHLFLGSQADNIADMHAKGRAVAPAGLHPEMYPRGEAHWNAKLTADLVRTLRHEYVPRKVSYRTLGKKYGVSCSAVEQAIKGMHWKHVT